MGSTDFGIPRRTLSILETTASGRLPQIQHTLPTATASHDQIAPWMSASPAPQAQPNTAFGTSFYNDSSDNISQGSQLSPGFRPNTGRAGAPGLDSPDTGYFDSHRRPSVASVTTASSTGSKSSSLARNGKQTYKKLQGFFGEESFGEESETASGKEGRSQSYSRHRDRNHSATSTTGTVRDGSPAPSHTPVPSSDVVPFLYQDSQVSDSSYNVA